MTITGTLALVALGQESFVLGKQQLAIQSLSIANSDSQNILSLFR